MQKHPLRRFVYCPCCGSNEFVEHNAASKQCNACGFTYYYNPRLAVVAVIRNGQGDLLVATRAKDPAKGTLDLPGGFSDCYENAEQAVVREVCEETGLEVTSLRYLMSQPNIYLYSGFEVHTIDVVFECDVKDLTPLRAMDDVAGLRFIPAEEIVPEHFGLTSIREIVTRLLAEEKGYSK